MFQTMPGIGVNLRVSFKLSQGGRKYMEDMHISKFTTSENGETQLGFFGVFDGHGGREAALFARDHLFTEITDQELFWSDNDDDVLKAIRNGFINTHNKMWKELDKWPRRTYSGYQSTAGTTSTIAIIREKKLYIGHAGDSGIVLGFTDSKDGYYQARRLTQDHKPELPTEKARIESIGGSVASGKSGIQRVVWNRPSPQHKGPVRRSTQMMQIPFLSVARSLGDLWSYDYVSGEFAVSPEPDVMVMELDPSVHKCLVIGSDGLWNMLSPEESVAIVEAVERETEVKFLNDASVNKYFWINHSRRLVNVALQKWAQHLVRADNTTAITILIDEYGPPKAQRLLAERKKNFRKLHQLDGKTAAATSSECPLADDVEMTGSHHVDAVDGRTDDGVTCTTPRIADPATPTPAPKPYSLHRQDAITRPASPPAFTNPTASPTVAAPPPSRPSRQPTATGHQANATTNIIDNRTDRQQNATNNENTRTSRSGGRKSSGFESINAETVTGRLRRSSVSRREFVKGQPASEPLKAVQRPVTRGLLKCVPICADRFVKRVRGDGKRVTSGGNCRITRQTAAFPRRALKRGAPIPATSFRHQRPRKRVKTE